MAIVTVQDIYRCDSCKAASDELGRGCKNGMLFPLMLIMGNFTECMNYEFDAEKVKLQLKRLSLIHIWQVVRFWLSVRQVESRCTLWLPRRRHNSFRLL